MLSLFLFLPMTAKPAGRYSRNLQSKSILTSAISRRTGCLFHDSIVQNFIQPRWP